jgi:uroporphyrinogen III methyltransferase / synthase
MTNDEKPLAGKRIVVTRAPEKSRELILALENRGAEVLLLPTVSFSAPDDWRPVDDALASVREFDWILFTSQNAVRFLSGRARELADNRILVSPQSPRIAAVGPATAQAAKEQGWSVDYIARNRIGDSLAEELGTTLAGRKVLLPRSDRVDSRLPDRLREMRADVTEVIAYRTFAPEDPDPKILARIRGREVDAIAFASPSAFHNLADSLDAAELASLSRLIEFAAIGPTTAQAIRNAGARVGIEINDASSVGAAGLADAIAKYYAARHSATAPAARRA